MCVGSTGRLPEVAMMVLLVLGATSRETWAATRCTCLYKHETDGPGPVQIETCLLGYREKGTRIKRVTHVRQVMRNRGDRALTMHFSDDRYSFNPLVSINGAQTGCGHVGNYLGGILPSRPTDGDWSPPAWYHAELPWTESQQWLGPGAHFTKQFPITRFFECAPLMDDSHFVHVKVDHEFVISGEKLCAQDDRGCRNARVRAALGANFPDVRLVPFNHSAPQCVVK